MGFLIVFAVAAAQSSDYTLLEQLIKTAQDYERFLAAQTVQSEAGRETAAPPPTAAAAATAPVGGMFCT